MQRFVHDENLIHLRKQFAGSLNPAQREEILRQIANELKNELRVVTGRNAE